MRLRNSAKQQLAIRARAGFPYSFSGFKHNKQVFELTLYNTAIVILVKRFGCERKFSREKSPSLLTSTVREKRIHLRLEPLLLSAATRTRARLKTPDGEEWGAPRVGVEDRFDG